MKNTYRINTQLHYICATNPPEGTPVQSYELTRSGLLNGITRNFTPYPDMSPCYGLDVADMEAQGEFQFTNMDKASKCMADFIKSDFIAGRVVPGGLKTKGRLYNTSSLRPYGGMEDRSLYFECVYIAAGGDYIPRRRGESRIQKVRFCISLPDNLKMSKAGVYPRAAVILNSKAQSHLPSHVHTPEGFRHR